MPGLGPLDWRGVAEGSADSVCRKNAGFWKTGPKKVFDWRAVFDSNLRGFSVGPSKTRVFLQIHKNT